MMDKGSCAFLNVMRLPEGGYVVSEWFSESTRASAHLYASDNIDKVLNFIRDKIVPTNSQPSNG